MVSKTTATTQTQIIPIIIITIITNTTYNTISHIWTTNSNIILIKNVTIPIFHLTQSKPWFPSLAITNNHTHEKPSRTQQRNKFLQTNNVTLPPPSPLPLEDTITWPPLLQCNHQTQQIITKPPPIWRKLPRQQYQSSRPQLSYRNLKATKL